MTPGNMNWCSTIVSSRDTLTEAKEGFDEPASQHVYSVQPCLPKDPAQLFSAEYLQAQELFMQPRDVDNCLRDHW